MSLTIRLMAMLAVLALGACETVSGAGRDIETAGEAIQSESNEAQY